jgi:uncharacterized protein
VLVGAILLRNIVPSIVGTAYVRPNEISIERPYIQRHIAATRSAFGIDEVLGSRRCAWPPCL